MQRPRPIILLILWFFWAAGRDLDALARFSISTDYYILASAGLAWLFFVLGGAVLLPNASAAFYLPRPTPPGFPVLLVALAAGALQNVVTVCLAFQDLPGVRAAYQTSRELRGLTVRSDELLDRLFTPTALWSSLAIGLVVYALVVWLARRNRAYFVGPDSFVAPV